METPEVTSTPQGDVVQENVETPAPETPQEEIAQEEAPVEETPETPEAPEVPETPEATAPKWKLKVDGQEVEVSDENELVTLAQKGYAADKRFQALSTLEKAHQQKVQLADQLMANPAVMKYAIAQQLGFDPDMVLREPQAPPQEWRETYPEEYGKRQQYFEFAQAQKGRFETALQGMITLNAQTANNAAFERARLEHNLNDEQYQQTVNFVQSRMRPSQTGFYSPEDVTLAVNALFGKERAEKKQLETVNKIQKSIKEAKPHSATSKKTVENLTPEQKEARQYLEFVKGQQGGGWQK